MKIFFALSRINLKGLLLSSSQHRKAGKKAASGVRALLLLSFIALYIGCIYSFLLASQLAPAGGADLVLPIMSAMAAMASFIFCIFNAASFVFGAKDNNLLLSLPISSFVIVLSKLAALYLENLFFCFCILLPATIAHVAFGGALISAVVFFLPVALLLPLLPTALSLVLSFLVSLFESRSKHRALLSIVCNLLFFAAIMIGSLKLNSSLAYMVQNIEGMRNALATYLPPFYWVRDCIADGSIVALLKLAVLSLGLIIAVSYLFSKTYKSLISKLESRSARNDYSLGTQSATSMRKALLRKELRKYFGSSIYLFNTIIGPLMLVGGSIYGLFARSTLLEALGGMGVPGSELLPMVCGGLGFLLAMSCITAPSISLESNRLWILKEAPIAVMDIFRAKLELHLLIIVPSVVFAVLCFGFVLSLSATHVLLLLLLGITMTFYEGLFGLWANLLLPKLDGVNDTVIVKQSASVLVAMLGGLLPVGLGALLCWLLGRLLGITSVLWLVWVLLIIGCLLLHRLLKTRGVTKFNAL